MISCYHKEVRFDDPVFQNLNFEQVGSMWKMLISRGSDLIIEFDQVDGNENSATAHWKAHYTFTSTGRFVINDINATFEIKDGLIVKHTDKFDFHRWASQALGLKGWLLGKTNFLRNKVQKTARTQLDRYMAKTSGS